MYPAPVFVGIGCSLIVGIGCSGRKPIPPGSLPLPMPHRSPTNDESFMIGTDSADFCRLLQPSVALIRVSLARVFLLLYFTVDASRP